MNIQPRALRRAQSGLSIVELMVGVAIGLIIVAAAATLVATQLTENRRLMLETQVQQDLRATADIIARELRRAGYQEESESLAGVWLADRPGDLPRANSLAALTFPSGVTAVDFKYFRSFGNTSFGFKQVGSVVKTFLGGNAAGSFQDLTDPNAVVISAFSVTQSAGPGAPIKLMCPRLCADGTDACWPTLQVRELAVSITGYPVTNPAMVRTVVSRVRLRNDAVSKDPSLTSTCP